MKRYSSMKKDGLDIKKVDTLSTELASVISSFMARPGIKWNEAFIVIIAGVSKLLQIVCKLSGFPEKELTDIICDGIKSYFEHGGDARIDEIIKATSSICDRKAN